MSFKLPDHVVWQLGSARSVGGLLHALCKIGQLDRKSVASNHPQALGRIRPGVSKRFALGKSENVLFENVNPIGRNASLRTGKY